MSMEEREAVRKKEERIDVLMNRIETIASDLNNYINNLQSFCSHKIDLKPKLLMSDIKQTYVGWVNILESFYELEKLGIIEKDGYKDYFEKIKLVRFYLKKIIPMVDKNLGEKIKEIDNEIKNSMSKSEKVSKPRKFFAGVSKIITKLKSNKKRKTSKYSLEK